MVSGAAKNRMLEQKCFFSLKNDAQSVANGDRRRVEIEICQCDICWSWSSNRWNLTQFSYHSCYVPYTRSLVVHISARLAQRTQNASL